MKSFLIETSVIIDYLKGKEEAKRLIDSLKGDLSSSYFCLAELFEGVMRVNEPDKHEEAILIYFASLTNIYSLDMRTVKKFGELRARLKKEGTIIEDIDLFLAATCLVYDLTLVTFNKKHFSHVKELTIA